jgi:hypothetical protein
MDKPKKEPIALRQRQDYRLCLNCGFPNRQSDTHCMYCSTSLVEDTGFFSWIRQTYYILRWRWQLKQKRENLRRPKKSLTFWKGLGYFCLGLVLSGAGVYIFTLSVTENSFSNALIACVLLLYGFFTLKSFLSKK